MDCFIILRVLQNHWSPNLRHLPLRLQRLRVFVVLAVSQDSGWNCGDEMEEEEWIYACEESIFDEDEQLWVVTMLSLMMLPIYEEMKIQAILFESLRTYLKNS